MAPAYERAASDLEPEDRLLKVNAEDEPALAARYGIQSIPMLTLFLCRMSRGPERGALAAATTPPSRATGNRGSLTSPSTPPLEPSCGEGDRVRLDVEDLRLNPAVTPTLALGFTNWLPTPPNTGRSQTPRGGFGSHRASVQASAARNSA
jgi:hypothetical protein